MKRFCVPVIMLFFALTTSAQTYEIGYKEYFSLFGAGLDDIKEQIKNDQEDNHPDMVLTYSNGISIYQKYNANHLGFEKNEQNETKVISHRVNIPATFKNITTKILKKSYPNYRPQLYGDDILIKDKLPIFEWEITDIKEKISGYNCILAKAIHYDGAKILAWFTDEIALNEGPREYWGLPGLILQVQIDDRVLIVATKVKKLKKDKLIEEPQQKETMTIKEFEAFKKELFRPRTIITPDGMEMTISNGKQ